MKVLQINVTANSGSHGRIAAGIGAQLISGGHQSYIAYGRTGNYCDSELIKIGGKTDVSLHLLKHACLTGMALGHYIQPLNSSRNSGR